MTISKTPRTDYRHADKDPQTHRFTKRPAAYVQHLSDDAWLAASIKQLDELHIPPPPEAWPRKAAPPIDWDEFNAMHEHIERETWRDVWADVRGVVLCAAFVLTVLMFASHAVGMWGQ